MEPSYLPGDIVEAFFFFLNYKDSKMFKPISLGFNLKLYGKGLQTFSAKGLLGQL